MPSRSKKLTNADIAELLALEAALKAAIPRDRILNLLSRDELLEWAATLREVQGRRAA